MIKRDITYENFDGDTVTETFYFHLSQAELLRLEVGLDGGLQGHMQKLVDAQDGGQIMDIIDRFITESVGHKSPDGARFLKTPEIVADFKSSPAYDAIFMEMCTNVDKAAAFINGIIPKDLAANVEKMSRLEEVKNNVETRGKYKQAPLEHLKDQSEFGPISDPAQGGNVFSPSQEPIVLTQEEVIAMDHAELTSGLAEGRYKLS